MQRIIVDLPEPEGPQTTTRSPLPTSRLMSVSTWKSPYHLCTWRISMTAPFAAPASLSAIRASPPRLALPAAVELTLQHLAVARHEKAEAEVDRGGEHVSLGREALPGGVGQRGVDRAEQVEEADDDDQRGVLEGADEAVDQRRDHHRQGLRQHEQPGAPRIAQPERVGRLDLPFRDRLQPAAHDLREIGGGEQDDRDLRPQQLVDGHPARQE